MVPSFSGPFATPSCKGVAKVESPPGRHPREGGGLSRSRLHLSQEWWRVGVVRDLSPFQHPRSRECAVRSGSPPSRGRQVVGIFDHAISLSALYVLCCSNSNISTCINPHVYQAFKLKSVPLIFGFPVFPARLLIIYCRIPVDIFIPASGQKADPGQWNSDTL